MADAGRDAAAAGSGGTDASEGCSNLFRGSVSLTSGRNLYLDQTFSTRVMVASIDRIDGASLRIRLVRVPGADLDAGSDDDGGVAGDTEWNVETRELPDLPLDVVQHGETLDLHHGATVHHFYGTTRSFILSRDDKPVLFGTSSRTALGSELEAFGLAITYGEQVCSSDGPACDFGYETLIVSRGGQTATVPVDESVRVGDLVIGGYAKVRLSSSNGGFCDAAGAYLAVVGYAVK